MPIYAAPYVYGDSSEPLVGKARAAAQALEQSFGQPPFPEAGGVVGDAPVLGGRAKGGDDDVSHLGGLGSATAIGDALAITGHARAGDDEVLAGARGHAEAYGDGLEVGDHARAGDDLVTAFSRFGSFAYGDAGLLSGHARGGDDSLTGSTDPFLTPVLFGDAETMQDFARGGDDVLGDAASGGGLTAYGDARVMNGKAVAGDDTLISGHGSDILYGDAAVVGPKVSTGADLFVFAPGNGHDQVMDFEPGRDRIELDGFGIAGFHDLAGLLHATADGVLISFDPQNDILLRGVTLSQLSSKDFLFE